MNGSYLDIRTRHQRYERKALVASMAMRAGLSAVATGGLLAVSWWWVSELVHRDVRQVPVVAGHYSTDGNVELSAARDGSRIIQDPVADVMKRYRPADGPIGMLSPALATSEKLSGQAVVAKKSPDEARREAISNAIENALPAQETAAAGFSEDHFRAGVARELASILSDKTQVN